MLSPGCALRTVTCECFVFLHIPEELTVPHSRFMKALKAQGMSRDDLPYKAPFQPWGSWFALVATAIITFFKGFDTFMPWNTATFITSYIAIPTFIVLYVGYKLTYKTRQIDSDKVDLVSLAFPPEILQSMLTNLCSILDWMLSMLRRRDTLKSRKHWVRVHLNSVYGIRSRSTLCWLLL